MREDKKDRLEFSCGIDGFDFAQMSLNNDGNVGIGTNDPSYKLVVNSSGGSLSVNDNGHLVSKQNLDVQTAGGRLIGESEVGMLGDIILAEPGALIGFAGPRVIKQTIGQDLPEGFQRSEFLLDKGFVDQIVPRGKIKNRLYQIIDLLN